MTPFMLQEDIVQEMKESFSGFKLTSAESCREISVFAQDVPLKSKRDDVDIFPYIIVRLEDGSIGEKNTCKVTLVFGVHDEGRDRNGNKDILNLIEKVCLRYSTNRIIAGKYTVIDDIEWTLQEEDIFPFYYGGVALNIEIPQIYIEDDLT